MCSNEHPDMHGNWVDGEPCENCDGTGEYGDDGFGESLTCPDCQGSGVKDFDDSVFDDDVI